MRLLGVDCDLTVVRSDVGWWDWLCSKGEVTDYPWSGEWPYNLGEVFKNLADPFQYWREVDYSQFKPIEGSVEVLEKLSKYFGIVFISQHKGSHGKSKYYWLNEHFPFNAGVMLTKEKYLMNDSVVAMIEDRKDHLEKFDENKRIQFMTPYTQTSDCNVAIKFEKWNDDIVKQICDEYL